MAKYVKAMVFVFSISVVGVSTLMLLFLPALITRDLNWIWFPIGLMFLGLVYLFAEDM